MGVWIEIELCGRQIEGEKVTPFMGVWIEISFNVKCKVRVLCHSLYGSVD